MTDGSSSNAKTFFVVLAAVLVGAGVISVIKSCSETSTHWETEKTKLVRMLRENDKDIDTMIAKPGNSMSLEELEKFGPRLKALQDIRTDGYSTLARLLEQKPFFSLNAEETQLLRKAKRKSGEPVESEPSPPIPRPQFVVVTYPTEFYKPDGSSIPISNGTRLKVIDRPTWTVLSVEYQGYVYSIQTALTQPSE